MNNTSIYKYSNCPSFAWIHFKTLFFIDEQTLWQSSGVIKWKTFVIPSYNSSNERGLVLYTASLITPKKKKSDWVRTGDLGPLRCSPSAYPTITKSFSLRLTSNVTVMCWISFLNIEFIWDSRVKFSLKNVIYYSLMSHKLWHCWKWKIVQLTHNNR